MSNTSIVERSRCRGEVNPFLAPREAAYHPASEAAAWRREGDLLVTPTAATLPPRCVKCNEPMAGLHLKRNLYCHHPLWFAALLLGALPYVVVALVVRRHAVVNVGLCSRHRAVRRRDLAIAWALGLLAVVGFFLGFALLDSPQQQPLAPLVIIGSPVVLVAACIWGIARTSVLRARKIDRQPAWLRGAGPEFLAQIEQGA